MSENPDFWRRHPVLAAAQVACGLGLAVTGVIRLTSGDSPWSTALALAFLAGAFVLWVMLVRRDD